MFGSGLLALALVCGLQDQGGEAPERRVEYWPDGSIQSEAEVQQQPAGSLELHGAFKAFHANGNPAAEGAYDRGLRSGRWRYWDEEGNLDKDRSATYRAVFTEYASGARREGTEFKGKYRYGRWTFHAEDGTLLIDGLYKRDVRRGKWTYYWAANGALCYEGDYSKDLRDGTWLFRHPDGSIDFELLSGLYREGERVRVLDDAAEPKIDLAKFPVATAAARLSPEDNAQIAAELREFAAGGHARQLAQANLLEFGRVTTPAILAHLRTLDLATPEGTELAFLLNYNLLAAMHNGHAYAWSPGTGERDVLRNRLTIARWQALWELTHKRRYWLDELAVLPEGTLKSEALFELPYDTYEPEVEELAALELIEALNSAERSKLLRKYGGKDTEEALELAIGWLLRHQNDTGYWDVDGFSLQCSRDGAGAFCTGQGRDGEEVGVTGLALLALMGDGGTYSESEHAEAIHKGIAWLAGRQDRASGLIGAKKHMEFVYGHAISTLAFCRALRGGGPDELRDTIHAATRFILEQQLAGGGWRYRGLKGEKHDASITGWMVQALVAARECGIPVPQDALDRASEALGVLTDPQTGRVGYMSKIERSSRVSAAQQYPNDLWETLTAVSVLASLKLGESPKMNPFMRDQVELILKRPPAWNSGTADYYGWYHGTYALFHFGGKAWKAWNASMKPALFAAQVTEETSHEYGSFSTDSAWAVIGGRVYCTAIAALTLEVYLER